MTFDFLISPPLNKNVLLLSFYKKKIYMYIDRYIQREIYINNEYWPVVFIQIGAKIQTVAQREKCQSIIEYLSVFNMPMTIFKKSP